MAHVIRFVFSAVVAIHAVAERMPSEESLQPSATRVGSPMDPMQIAVNYYVSQERQPGPLGRRIETEKERAERERTEPLRRMRRKRCDFPEDAFPGIMGGEYAFDHLPGFDKFNNRYVYVANVRWPKCERKFGVTSKKKDEDSRLAARMSRDRPFIWAINKPSVEAQFGETILPGELGLLPTFAHVETDGCLYMLTEFAGSGDFQSKLAKGKLSIKNKLRIFNETLAGLYNLHKRGVVHRNISGFAIQLAAEGRGILDSIRGSEPRYHPMINGFESACCFKEDADTCSKAKLPQCGTSVGGAIGFMSPRMLALREPARPEDDLWSMGKILLQIIHDTDDVQFTEREVKLRKSSSWSSWDYKNYVRGPQEGATDEVKELKAYIDSLPFLTGENIHPFDFSRARPGSPGDIPFQTLAEYLLCNDCKKFKSHHEGEKATLHAIKLTKELLQAYDVAPKKNQLNRPSKEDVEVCVEILNRRFRYL